MTDRSETPVVEIEQDATLEATVEDVPEIEQTSTLAASSAGILCDDDDGSDLVVEDPPAEEEAPMTVEEMKAKRAKLEAELKAEREEALVEAASRTMWEEFEASNESSAMPEMTARNDEALLESQAMRFMLAQAAQSDEDRHNIGTGVRKRIEKATRMRDFAWCHTMPKSTAVGTMSRLIKECGSATELIRKIDADLAGIAEREEAAGKTIKLNDEDYTEGKAVKRSAIDRIVAERKAAGKQLNVIVDGSASYDEFIAKKRSDAKQARAFIEGGLQLAELDDGVTSETSTAVRKTYVEALEAAALAIQEYEEEASDMITSSFSDPTLFVGVNLPRYYAGLLERGIKMEDLGDESWFTSDNVREAMGINQEKIDMTLTMQVIMDTGVFVPRMALLFAHQPMPRVVEFSRVFRIYMAALLMLEENVPVMNARAKHREAKHLRKLVESTIQRASGGSAPNGTQSAGTVQVNPDYENLPLYSDSAPTKETINKQYQTVYGHAMDDWRKGTAALQTWHDSELAYHKGEIDLNQLKLMTASCAPGTSVPRISREKYEENPDSIGLQYYSALWELNNHTCVTLLNAHEARILLWMQRFICPEDRNAWFTRRLFPLGDQCHPLTVKETTGMNEVLGSRRDSLWTSLLANKRFNGLARTDQILVATPLDSTDVHDDKHVFEQQAWSATVGQMKQYHKNMQTLFNLSPEQQQIVLNIKVAKGNKKNQNAGKAANGTRSKRQMKIAKRASQARK